MECQEYDEIIRNLMRIAAHQESINQDQYTLIERLTAAIERLDVTQARIEARQARRLPPGARGQEG